MTPTGWKAVAAIVVVVHGFVGFRMVTARRALEERGEAVLAAGRARIGSMSGHGSLDDLVVKVELEPSADLPPGTELVRYYRMEYSRITGWRHRGNSTAVGYYLPVF